MVDITINERLWGPHLAGSGIATKLGSQIRSGLLQLSRTLLARKDVVSLSQPVLAGFLAGAQQDPGFLDSGYQRLMNPYCDVCYV